MAVDFVYPPACAHCSVSLNVEDHERPRWWRLCRSCALSLSAPVPNRCARCSAPVGPYLDTTAGCTHCRGDRFAFARAVSLGVYEGALRGACLSAKGPRGGPLATGLAELLWSQVGHELDACGIDLVVPIPHHWTSRLWHSHFPPVSISRALSRRLKARWHGHILAKVRRTPCQVSLSATERRSNLRGAFRVVGGARLQGLRVLLADDVLTTGTTAHRAAVELIDAGAAQVLVAVIARGIVQSARQPVSGL
jgi:predicted amidophosphoribosyltransferase